MDEKCYIPDEVQNNDYKKSLLNRLKRIEGQVKGVHKMVDNDIYCDDILNQISSIRAALNGVSKLLMEKHLKNCIVNKIKNDDDSAIPELIKTLNKMLK